MKLVKRRQQWVRTSFTGFSCFGADTFPVDSGHVQDTFCQLLGSNSAYYDI